MRENYITVGSSANAEILINKSRFIGHAARAETEAEAIAFIDSIKMKHRQATHNCSAYIIGEHDSIQKANDDGEPSGTAGVPMLEVLKKQGLKDTVLVVTRYYGGIKLGGGGLIRAYGKSASEAIAASGVVELFASFDESIHRLYLAWQNRKRNPPVGLSVGRNRLFRCCGAVHPCASRQRTTFY